jgi:imidazolonepropionase-like amidohydrolase
VVHTRAQVLKMATADNAELLAMSGPRNPYPRKLGVIEEGALADLLLVNGDPVANLKRIDPHRSVVVIMKDGKPYKNFRSKLVLPDGAQQPRVGVQFCQGGATT